MPYLRLVVLLLCMAYCPGLCAMQTPLFLPSGHTTGNCGPIDETFDDYQEWDANSTLFSTISIVERDTVPQPDIRFEETIYDFGDISKSKKPRRTHTFQFTNTGSANLVILHVATGCGCTTPKYTEEPVKPGAQGKLVVTYDASDRPLGHFTKSVTVYINSSHSYVRIFIQGNVVE